MVFDLVSAFIATTEILVRISGSLVLENGVCDEETERDYAYEVEEIAEFDEALGKVHERGHDADRGKEFPGKREEADSAISKEILDRIEADDAEHEADRNGDRDTDHLAAGDG